MNIDYLLYNRNCSSKQKFFLLLLSVFTMQVCLAQQPFAKWTDKELILDNGIVQRTIQLPATTGKFITTSYHPISTDFKYFTKINPDFQFEANGVIYSGNGNWILKNIAKHTDTKQGDGAAVTLLSADQKIELTIRFLLYPKLPVIRKDLVIKSGRTNTDVRIGRCGEI